MLSIDINCDMGESTHLWPYDIEKDKLLLSYVSSINLACGYHAGDAHTMYALAEAAAGTGIAIGAHPGFPDRDNFGRTNMLLSPSAIYELVLYQIEARPSRREARPMRPSPAAQCAVGDYLRIRP